MAASAGLATRDFFSSTATEPSEASSFNSDIHQVLNWIYIYIYIYIRRLVYNTYVDQSVCSIYDQTESDGV